MSRDLVVALSGGIGGAKLALGLSRILPAGRSARRRQCRRRFRASRPAHLARHRHADVHAGRPRQYRSSAGAGRTRPGRSWRRSRRSAARTGSASAIAILRFMSSARAGSRPGETLSADHRRLLPPPRRRSPRAADDRRSRAHAVADGRGLARFPGLFRAPAVPPGRARACLRRRGQGARRSPIFWRRLRRRTAARGDHLPVQPLHQRRADPRRAGHARRARRPARAPVIAVSPIIGGRAVKGPTAKMMTELGMTRAPPRSPSATAICSMAMSMDDGDAAEAAHVTPR